ncbi:hypothetical protein TBLA_0A08740 [Henningerozyma blattae CBS 6284]|uniref:SAM-dependent MTase RsmB/NOP-type domain-containing protein n=1 Tax=Henningerozyma blattae (strain ATCC 34711 / CBS 6284 / DSM 70876 / NBRC 10599 / NRRL Y-10934 / UCD 77-7) TaxID=1071380 RepID=I2GX11_HENB6|nr:hypothetical protein TBLA_0A08740 [Tetrapisispora blattae CBS 6284]CCH58663.1 hypothetical protein TBLA_0A08740 [Tetrapisispora blattae CBS 6284]
MGRRRNNNGGKKKIFGTRDDSRSQNNWSELVRENAKWETYYKKLALFPEDQWDEFKKSCQTPLPLTFRVTGSRKHAQEVLSLFEKNHLPNLTDVVYEGEKIKNPIQLPWYPNHFAWQLDVPKTVIRKQEQFAKMQRFLVVENAVGNISRQEAVSMIPPLVLEVKPHHTVLDMCAAPGSKTAQMIEALHMENAEPTGFVVANDSDYRRSHMLVHQLKRLNSANMMVVNHDAQFFPRIKLSVGDNKAKDALKFDRILCDVPCSGDGTMRKNVNVWKDWNTQAGLGLHTIQYNILNRGLHLLKTGGRLVYSTCSLNPIENEAVVARALRTWGSKIKIINCDDKLPGLIRSNGVTQWPVFDRNMESKNKGDEGTLESWFPPTDEEVTAFNLQNCMRVYPHQQNTGGFFITVIEKVEENLESGEPQPKKAKIASSSSESNSDATPAPKPTSVEPKKEKLPRDANEEPFVFIDPHHKALQNVWSFYGIDDKFDKEACLVRNATGEPTRVVYTVAPALKEIIKANEDRLKIVYSGVRLFVAQRSDIECSWRIQSEALPIMKHHMKSERIVEGSLELLKVLLTESFPSFELLEKTSGDLEYITKMKKLSAGCAFVEVKREDSDKESLFLPIWNGTKCVNLMVSKEDGHELLYRVYGIETSSKDNSKVQKKQESTKPEASETPITTDSAADEPAT